MIHKVQYYETDMMGVAHHANYIRWMEEARIDFMNQIGFPFLEFLQQRIPHRKAHAQARIIKRGERPDEIVVFVPERLIAV